MSQRTDTVYICDRCNKNEHVDVTAWGTLSASIYVGGRKHLPAGKDDGTNADLCENCSKSLWRWWTNRSE